MWRYATRRASKQKCRLLRFPGYYQYSNEIAVDLLNIVERIQRALAHTFITHSFLLKGEEPPVCIGCDQHITMKQILLTCSGFIEMRESPFTAQSLRMLFRDISLENFF